MIHRFLAPFPIVWPTERGMNEALREFTRYHLSHGLGVIDALIAATAIEMGEPLATFNTRHFSAVPGLAIIQPYTR